MVVFDFDVVMLREHATGVGVRCLHEQPGPHALEEGFYDLALELECQGIPMVVVSNSDRKTLVPILISNWRFHQRKSRHADFEKIAKSGIFGRVQCIDTQIRGKLKHNGQQMPGFDLDARGRAAPRPVAKNGMIRLAIHWAIRSGALSAADVSKDGGVGACCTLLIDDRPNNVDAFRRLGGHAYMPLPHEGLSNSFDLSRLHSPSADERAGSIDAERISAGSIDAERISAGSIDAERISAIASSELRDRDWWLAEWKRTPEGGGATPSDAVPGL
jgi:hypothetical protein